jgi:hypothetical protein
MHRNGLVAILAMTVVVSAGAQQRPTTTQLGARTEVPATSPGAQGLLPGTRATVLNSIEGTALDASNTPLKYANVRLRDARYGRIVGTQRTTTEGTFAFRDLDPGTYIVELVGDRQSVLATSPIITVDNGDIATVILKLPFRIPPGGGFFGTTMASATAIAAAAAASGVLASRVTGSEASPTQVVP